MSYLEYKANSEALNFFASLKGKIAILSVAGIYRTGKSFLLNRVILNQKNGFAVGPTTNPKTKGIWVWGKPLLLETDSHEMINVCVLDSEGLNSTEEDINHDLRLFSITLLLSSTFLYNTIGAIDEGAIDSLGLVLRLCEHLKAESYNDFPDFNWILRDFSLALVDKDNLPLTPKMYLENCLSAQAGDSEVRNKIRESICSSFPNRNCKTLVRPLTEESFLQNLDKMELHNLRPEFVEQVIDFRKSLLSNIKTKKIKGKEITAEVLVELIKIYVQEINTDKLPRIETGWKYVCQKECEIAMDFIEGLLDERITQLHEKMPSSKKELHEIEQKIINELKIEFENKTKENEFAEESIGEINKKVKNLIREIEEEMKVKNVQETKNFIKKEFEYIEKKLKQGEYKSMGELVKEIEVFYEFYRKKCPYKDEIQVALETLLKKFSDCSIMLYKSHKNKLEGENNTLKEELHELRSENSSKEEKYKIEKSMTQNRIAVLEMSNEETQKQNKILAISLCEIEAELEKKQKDAELKRDELNNELELEIIIEKKKLIEMTDAFREIEIIKNTEINTLKNSILLQQNEIEHINEEKFNLYQKIDAESATINQLKNLKEQIIEENLIIMNKKTEECEQTKNFYEYEIKKHESTIKKLELSIEELKETEEKNSIEYLNKIAFITSNLETEKEIIAHSLREEIRKFKEEIETKNLEFNNEIKKLQSEINQKELELKMGKLEVEKDKAILYQKIEFLQKECLEKEHKINKLLSESECYLSMFEEKEGEIGLTKNILNELQASNEAQINELFETKNHLEQELHEKLKEIKASEDKKEKIEEELCGVRQELALECEKTKASTKNLEERVKELSEKLNYELEKSDKTKECYEKELEFLKQENNRAMDEQKKTVELSLVQLKNYHELEKERLEKRFLEERKKHEQSETETLEEAEHKYKKLIRNLQEEMGQSKIVISDLEEQLMKVENECELRLMSLEEERENEQRTFNSRYELLERKYQDVIEELNSLEKNHEKERIDLIKKIETCHFDVSKKEKELMQAISKKETADNTIAKKDVQIENIKKLMNQEIECSMKKVTDIQAKYQKLNEEYMQLKIESDKEIALSKQRNEFLNAKMMDINKEKEIGSTKNLEKMDKQKISELKEQNEKYKMEILTLEARVEASKRSLKEIEANHKKAMIVLEKENMLLSQRQEANQSKLGDLEEKLREKIDHFLKEQEEQRDKSAQNKGELQKEIDNLREKYSKVEEEKSDACWKLQVEVTLLTDKIKHVESQRDQVKKELEESEKRLQSAFMQLKKTSEKSNEDHENKKVLSDKKHTSQIEMIKETLRMKTEEYEDTIRKLKEEIKTTKDKIIETTEKLHKVEKTKNLEKILQEENEALKKEKEVHMISCRSEKTKESEDWRRKLSEAEKKNKELEKTNNNFVFTMEKEQTKWSMERENLQEKLRNLQDELAFEKNKSQLGKNKNESKK